jgi:arsenate reductase
MIKILHNNRCRKSREGLAFLETKTTDYELVEYLKTPPSVSELTSILEQLEMKAIDLVRKNEEIWKKQFKGKELSEQELIQAMVEYPKLIERPIVIKDDKAVLGRPAEKINELFDE